MRKCSECGHVVEDERLVACPECHTSFAEAKVEGTALTQEQEDEILKRLWQKQRRWFFGELSVLAIVGVGSLFAIYLGTMNRVEVIIVDEVVKEFKTERIRDTVEQVAKSEASEIMEDELRPSILRFEEQVNSYLAEAQAEATAVENELEEIREAVAPPKLVLKRKEINKTESGYTALLVFNRSKSGYLGIVSFAAQVLSDTSSRIVVLRPANTNYSTWEDGRETSGDGKAAWLSFQIMGVGNPIVELQTSGPCTVLLTGSHDLEALFLEIQ